jgi:hypothetical protein
MTTNLDIDKVTEFWSEDQLARIPLIDKYAGRNLENLQVDAESGYVTVVFKDTLHETIVFKYDTTTREVAEEIENELHRIMHEITEDNEQDLLQGVFTLWLLNGRLTYFAEFTDIEVDTSQTYTMEVPEGEPDDEVAQDTETGV